MGGGIAWIIMWTLAGAALAATAVILWFRLRRSAPGDVRPHCRACRFDLSGLAIGADRISKCPECGAILLKPWAVTIGLPRRAAWVSILMLVQLTAGLAMVARGGYDYVVRPQFAPYKPSWVLKLEIQYSSISLAQAAWTEMVSRTHSDSTRRWLVRRAITEDLNRSGRAPWSVSDWLRTEWEAGRVPAEEVMTVLKGRASVKLKPDPPFRLGERPMIRYNLTTGVQTSFWIHEVQVGEVRATVDGTPVYSGRTTPQQYQNLGSLMASIPSDRLTGTPRTADVRIEVSLDFRIENPSGRATWSEIASDRTTINIEPHRRLGWGSAEDPATARSVERFLSVPAVEVWFDPRARDYTPFLKLIVHLDFDPTLPVAIAADLHVRPMVAGASWRQIGTVVADSSKTPRSISVEGTCNDRSAPEWRSIFERTTPAAFEVRLVPNHDLAAARLNDERYLGSPILIDQVPTRPWGERRFRGHAVTFHPDGGYSMTPLPKR